MSALEEYIEESSGWDDYVPRKFADAAIAELEAKVKLWRHEAQLNLDRAEQAEAALAHATEVAEYQGKKRNEAEAALNAEHILYELTMTRADKAEAALADKSAETNQAWSVAGQAQMDASKAEDALAERERAYKKLLFICDWFDDCYPEDYVKAWGEATEMYG